jgi:hypothetical protein
MVHFTFIIRLKHLFINVCNLIVILLVCHKHAACSFDLHFFFLECLCTPALVLNSNVKYRNIFCRPVPLFWSYEIPAVRRRPPCRGFIYCSIPAAARLRSAVQRCVFSSAPPFSLLRILTAIFLMVYSLHECLFPLRPYLLFSSHPSPCTASDKHSLLVVVYWYPFFTFLIPTILPLFLFSHFVTALLPSTNETFFVLQTAFLFGHR